MFFGLRYTQEGYGPRETWQEKMRRCLAAGAHFPPLLVMDPIVARLFIERGIDTKQELIDWCAGNALLPAREYWDDQWVQTLLRPLAVAGVEPYATPPQGQARRDRPDVRAPGDQHRRRRRRDPGRLEDVRRPLRKTVSIDAWR